MYKVHENIRWPYASIQLEPYPLCWEEEEKKSFSNEKKTNQKAD